MTAPTLSDLPKGWEDLDEAQRARRVVAARAVLRESVRLVGATQVAGLLIEEFGHA